MATRFLAGAAQIEITPPIGTDMGGYGGRAGPAEGVHDELLGAALYLGCEHGVILVTADLVGITRETAMRVAAQVAEQTDVDESAVMITCSHTHSGPAMPCLPCLGRFDAAYLDTLERRLVEVAISAWARRVPARWACTRAPTSIAINRRGGRRDYARCGFSPENGATAPYIDLMYVVDEQDAALAVWMCHAAHPVTLRHTNLLFSADWVGYARAALRRYLPDSEVLFAQGCAGNIISWPQGTFEIAQRQGESFAHAVMAGLSPLVAGDVARVGFRQRDLHLPLSDPPPPEEAQAILDTCLQEREEKADEANRGVTSMLDGAVFWAEDLLVLALSGETGRTIDLAVQVIRIDDFAIVGLGGEMFVEYALSIDAASRFAITAVAGYTNGNIGYVPTAQAFAEGGYEVNTAIRYYGTTMLTPEAEAIILRAVQEMLEHV